MFLQLGILWCTRGEFEKAKKYLFRSLDTYRTFKSRAQHDKDEGDDAAAIRDIHDLLQSPDDERSSQEKKERSLDLLNTHTYFFLAQVICYFHLTIYF